MSNEQQPKKRKFTFKQRKWLKVYARTMNGVEAAMQSYDIPDTKEGRKTASVISSQNIAKLSIPIEELMDEMGLTDERLLDILDSNLQARKPYGQDLVEFPDHAARNKALELALKLKRKLIDRIDHTTKGEALKTALVEFIGEEKKDGASKNKVPKGIS